MQNLLIQVDTVQLERDRQAALAQLREMRTALANVYSEVAELDAMWDGEANAAFNQVFETDRQLFTDILAELERQLADIEYARTKYDECDRQVSAAIAAVKI